MASKSFLTAARGSTPLSSSRPSPSPSQPSALATGQIHSQTADTGTGSELLTQVNYTAQYLKSKPRGTRLSFEDILSYLSLRDIDYERREMMKMALTMNPAIQYDHTAFEGLGGFAFKPKHDIANETQLLQRLQGERTAAGFPAKGLEEGWPEWKDDISAMKEEHKVLVIAAKKDDAPRMIWPDDPSLWHHLDEEFKEGWSKIRLPTVEDTAAQLEKHGLLPTSKSKKVKVVAAPTQKKPKQRKGGGKVTNKHMVGILKEYGHTKK